MPVAQLGKHADSQLRARTHSSVAWQVFYLFGALGLVWSLWWERLMEGVVESEPEIAQALGGFAGGKEQQVPWRAFLRNRPIQALGFTHFCNNWCAGC